MYITSTTTLKFTGAFTYQFIFIGIGGTGGNGEEGNGHSLTGGGGGGGGAVVGGQYVSTAGDSINFTMVTDVGYSAMGLTNGQASKFSIFVNIGGNGTSSGDMLGTDYDPAPPPPYYTDAYGESGTAYYDQCGRGGALGKIAYYDYQVNNGSIIVTSASGFTNLTSAFSSMYVPRYSPAIGYRSVSNSKGGAGGGAGAGGNAEVLDNRPNGTLGNQGGGGGKGYTWIDNIEYARGGQGGSILGSTSTGLTSSNTAGSGGTGASTISGRVNGSKGQPGMFAIAWK